MLGNSNANKRAQLSFTTDLNELNRLMSEAIKPLLDSFRDVEAKVDKLSVDHVTRADFEKLRADFQATVSNLEQRFPSRDLLDGKFGAVDQRLLSYAERLAALEKRANEDNATTRKEAAEGLKALKDEVKDIRATIGQNGQQFWTRIVVGIGASWTAIQLLQYFVQHVAK